LSYGIENAEMIKSHRVFLDLENPRVPVPFQDEDEAIAWLCDNEDVLTLARDIHDIGPNPLELVAVMKRGSNAFVALEGNRRVCAIHLLNDPARAPSQYRDRFKALSESWTPVKELFCVPFENRASVQVWLDRLHGGKDEGRGRSSWGSDVKTRRTKTSSSRSNQLPLALLDYGEENGLISKEHRKSKLAIIQRFSTNPIFRATLGISQTPEGFATDLPKADFDKLLGRLLSDVIEKGFTAHKFNSDKVVEYTNTDLGRVPVSGGKVEPHKISGGEIKSKGPSGPSKPASPTKLRFSQSLQDQLFELGNYKLRKLHYSLTKLSAKDHTPLLYVGLWSLVECLSSLHGRNARTDFTSYLNGQRLEGLGLGDKQHTRSLRRAIQNISELGNGTKHDGEAAGFSHEQLINDFQVVQKLLKKLVQDCIDASEE